MLIWVVIFVSVLSFILMMALCKVSKDEDYTYFKAALDDKCENCPYNAYGLCASMDCFKE